MCRPRRGRLRAPRGRARRRRSRRPVRRRVRRERRQRDGPARRVARRRGAVAQLEVVRRDLEQRARDVEEAAAHLARGFEHRARRQGGGAAPAGTHEVVRRDVGVAPHHAYMVQRDGECVGRELGERRLVTLAVRLLAREDGHGAVGLDADARLLLRAGDGLNAHRPQQAGRDRRGLHISGEAGADVAPRGSRGGDESGPALVARQRGCDGQRLGDVDAPQIDAETTAARELRRCEQVAATDLGPVDPEPAGGDVERALPHERLHFPRAAVRHVGRLVGGDELGAKGVVGDAIRGGEQRPDEVRVAVRRIAHLRVRAEIQHEVDTQADQATVPVEAGFDRDALLACLARGEEVLRARLDPADGRVEHHRRGRERGVFARQPALLPERAADVRRRHAHSLEREPQRLRELRPQLVRRLVPGREMQRLGRAVEVRDAPATLHRRVRHPMLTEPLAHDQRRPAQRAVGSADAVLLPVHHVRAELRPQQPGVRVAGTIHVDHRRLRLVVDVHELRRVLRERARRRDDDRDRVADVAHDIVGQRGMGRSVETVERDRPQLVEHVRQVGRPEGRVYAGRGADRAELDAGHARECMRAPHEDGVEQPGRVEIGDELGDACEKSSILDASHTRAGEPRRARASSAASPARNRSFTAAPRSGS